MSIVPRSNSSPSSWIASHLHTAPFTASTSASVLPVKLGMLLLFSSAVAAAPSPPPLCEASVRPLIDEGPLLLYTDLNNPSETGLVDDAAVWEARRV